MIETPHDCLVLLNYLKSKFLENKEKIELELLTINSIGQVAVDLVDRNCYLANQWIKDWLESGNDDSNLNNNDNNNNINNNIVEKKNKKNEKELSFYDFIAICEIHIDTNQEIANSLRELEELFLPISPLLLDSSDSRPSTSRDSARSLSKKPKKIK